MSKFVHASIFFLVVLIIVTSCTTNNKQDKPNFIVIFADDMGYGDIGVFGHPSIRTPNLDKMAVEGQKWTNFYVAAPVCTPSRAGLLTGRLPIRSGMCSDNRRVLFPNSNGGLPQSELTIARLLKGNGYKTAAVGKWHLGHLSPHLPTDHGFDSYFGIPYSNDMNRILSLPGGNSISDQITFAEDENYQAYNVPIMRDKEIVERPADQRTLTKRYTEEVIAKITEYKNEPFFIYLAHNLPHIPLFRAEAFKDKSLAGIYGDVIEEIDWSTGQILEALKKEGIAENTLVVFTSDNGPWHIFNTHGGTAGMLNGAKGGTFEGGMRVPAIFWWPGTLKQDVVMDMATTMDLLPTFCQLSGTKLPDDRVYDGYDVSALIKGTGKSERDYVLYYWGETVYALRKGDYKVHFYTQNEYRNITAHSYRKPEIDLADARTEIDPPLLYNVNVDPSEKFNIAADHPEMVDEMRNFLQNHVNGLIPVENQLEK